jgi:L-lysine exporter family protein LysE/ArgO
MTVFFQGLLMGLVYTAPIGMQNMFVINASLSCTRRRTAFTSIVVIFFDITLSFSCFFGIGAILQHFKWLNLLLLFFGGLVILFIAVSLLRKTPTEFIPDKAPSSKRKTIVSAFAVTWLNPQAILDGTMILGAFHASFSGSQSSRFILGIALASCVWFTGLTLFVSVFRSSLSPRLLHTINMLCGIVILFYALRLLYQFCIMLPAFLPPSGILLPFL